MVRTSPLPAHPRDVRRTLGLSRERMARLFDVSAKTVERWESRVAETEVASGCLVSAIDGFDEELLDAEEAASLKLELAELKEEK